jgi:hypothetical protein
MYEHIVPVSPFEENKERTTTIYESTNMETKKTGYKNNHPEELQKSITTTTTSANIDRTNNGGLNNNDNNYNKSISVTENRSRGFRSFRL